MFGKMISTAALALCLACGSVQAATILKVTFENTSNEVAYDFHLILDDFAPGIITSATPGDFETSNIPRGGGGKRVDWETTTAGAGVPGDLDGDGSGGTHRFNLRGQGLSVGQITSARAYFTRLGGTEIEGAANLLVAYVPAPPSAALLVPALAALGVARGRRGKSPLG